MSFQRPGLANGIAGPSSSAYSEFLKDIYSSLRSLTLGLATITSRLDTISSHLLTFDARLDYQDQMTQSLATRLNLLVQQTENTQIRQTTNGLSILSELDTMGSRQVEPSTGLAELGSLNSKSKTTSSPLSKLSVQLSRIPEFPELSREQNMDIDLDLDLDLDLGIDIQIPDVEAIQTIQTIQTNVMVNPDRSPVLRSPVLPPVLRSPVLRPPVLRPPVLDRTQEHTKPSAQLGNNFLILD